MSSAEFAGSLSEQVLIEQPAAARDALGVREDGWETVCRCRASVRLESVGAQAQGEALSALSRYRVTIRRRDGIALDQRVSWGERRMIVRQLFDDPLQKDRIAMQCEEVR